VWPLLKGAPKPVQPGSSKYDAARRKMAKFLGLDFLFCTKEFCQSVTTDGQGNQVLVNSSLKGEILAVRPVPEQFREKPWFTSKIRFPRAYLGVNQVEKRVSKLSYLLHLVTEHGFKSHAHLKAVNRLVLIWCQTRYTNFNSLYKYVAREASSSFGKIRKPGATKKVLPYPRRCGEICHANGIVVPIWTKTPRKGS